MSRKLSISVVASIVVGAALAIYASSPLRRTDAGVQRWLERATPIGSSLSDVEATVARRGWFSHRGEAGGHEGPWQLAGTYVRGELGEYQGLPFRTSVKAVWDFDVSNRLTGIRIWKTRDGL